jgi:hypothetical protein
MRSVENELMECFGKFQEKLLMAGYDVEFENRNEIIEKVSEPVFDVIASAIFSELIVEIVVKPEQSNPLVGKFTFGNSMDPIEDVYFRMNEYYNLYANGSYIELDFVLYDYEVYQDIYSPDGGEEEIPKIPVDEIIDGHIEEIKNILKAYDIKSRYDDILNSVTFRVPLKVAITMFLV